MAEKYFVCPTCRTLVRKPKTLFHLSKEMEEQKHKSDVLFVDVKPTVCPICQSNIETEEIIKGNYDKKVGPYQTAISVAVLLAIPLAFGVNALLESGWFLSYLLSLSTL